MKRSSFCLALSLVASSVLTATLAGSIPADSKITAVTVYADRAVVTRTATVNLDAAGPAEVVFDRLPRSLIPDSVQVSGSGDSRVTILSVDQGSTFVPFAPDERVRTIDRAIADLQVKRRELADQVKIEADQSLALDRYEAAVMSPERGTPPPSAADADRLLAYLAAARGKVAERQRAFDREDADLAAQQTALQQERGKFPRRGNQSYAQVTVKLNAASAGTLNLSVRYAMVNVSWVPSYDARVSSEKHTVELAYSGMVQQQTGEDWRDVTLTLSTAQPALGGGPTAPAPWILNVATPVFRRQMIEGKNAQDSDEAVRLAPFAVTAAGARPEPSATVLASGMGALAPRDALSAQAQSEHAATSTSFSIAAPATIPSDNTQQKVPITTIHLEGTPDYLTIPKAIPAAFLTDHVVNTSDFPLLGGAMSVFLDNNFTATSSIDEVMPGEKFDLALGADEGISVKRKLLRQYNDGTGLINKRSRTAYDYSITLENHQKSDATVTVQDQVPISRSDKIVVKVLAPDANTLKPDAEGTVKWTLTLKPGEKREIPLKFTIDYPAGTRITGLE